MKPEIKLYGYPTSPFVLKLGCVLKYKQLSFDFIAVHPVTRVQIKFSNQHQVPVLSIDQKWKNDSTPIALWLDEKFPQYPVFGDNEDEKQTILKIDHWISNQLLPGRFRLLLRWEKSWDAIRNGWILSAAMNDSISIPGYLRLLWPLLIKRADFLHRMVNKLNLEEPVWEMHHRLANEFIEHLSDGPFLGGLSTPSMADLSAYPTIIFAHLMGLHGRNLYLERDEIIQWCKRVQAHLPNNPLLVGENNLKRNILV